ncbi:MAG TPA: pyrroloquinoline-quinone synthase PqqC [Polyangiaceae bacterium]
MTQQAALEERLRQEGRARYHDRHPFHRRMHAGALSPRELRTWVVNRYYYQTRLPIKDALIVAKSESRAFRRVWSERIHEQDGRSDGDASGEPAAGGLELWLRLAGGVGLDRSLVESFRAVVPGVRAACDRYVSFVRDATLLEAVASSLTECFAPELMARRVEAWTTHYDWIPSQATEYFGARVVRARKDAEHGLAFVLEHATTPELEELAVRALVTKCDILWSMLDAIEAACDAEARWERSA